MLHVESTERRYRTRWPDTTGEVEFTQLNVASRLPATVATDVGALGRVEAVKLGEYAEQPSALQARTENVYVVPAVRLETVRVVVVDVPTKVVPLRTSYLVMELPPSAGAFQAMVTDERVADAKVGADGAVGADTAAAAEAGTSATADKATLITRRDGRRRNGARGMSPDSPPTPRRCPMGVRPLLQIHPFGGQRVGPRLAVSVQWETSGPSRA
jgi:hypothetical protein